MGTILVDWLQAALRYAAPLLLVAVGEVFAERSGVINMGVEGIMLVGALAGVAGAYYLKSLVLAVLITIIVGALMGLVVSYLTVSRRTNQVVTGLMINMLCLGATDMLFSMMSDTHQPLRDFPHHFPGIHAEYPGDRQDPVLPAHQHLDRVCPAHICRVLHVQDPLGSECPRRG